LSDWLGKAFPWLALHCSPPLLRGTPPQRPLAIVILNDILFIVILNGEAVKDPGPKHKPYKAGFKTWVWILRSQNSLRMTQVNKNYIWAHEFRRR
jgi:hypothetical protein